MSFRAGEVHWDFVANRTPILRDANKTNKDLGVIAKKGGKTYETAFAAKHHGRKIGADLKKGILYGTKGIKTALKASVGLAALATGAAVSIGVLGKSALKSAAEMKVSADAAGLSAERYQELAYASDRYGISGEKLADIFKDTRERIGEMLNAGAGPMQDWLDDIGYRAGLTAEDFRNLSGDQAMSLVIRTMEKMGANGAQLSATMESLASDSTRLIPLYKDNGRELNKLSKEARDAGVVLSNDTAQGAFDANNELDRLGTTIRTGLTKAVVESAPEIEEFTGLILDMVPPLIEWASEAVSGFNDLRRGWDAAFGDGFAISVKADAAGIERQVKDLDRLEKAVTDFDNMNVFQQAMPDGAKAFGTTKQLFSEFFGLEEYKRLKNNADEMLDLIAQKRAQIDTAYNTAIIGELNDSGSVPDQSGSGSGLKITPKDTDAERANNARIRAAIRLRDETRTPLEAYAAQLEMIGAVEKNSFVDAGGAETFSRARADALIELTGEVENLDTAFTALGESITKGHLAEADAARVMAALRAESRERVDEDREAALDAAQAIEDGIEREIEKRSELVEQLIFEAERKRELASLSGDTKQVELLDQVILRLRERNRLIEGGATDADAITGADEYGDAIKEATLEGKHRDAFRNGVEGALNELEGPLNSMFDAPIGTLAGALFDFIDAFAGINSGGGAGGSSGGGIADIFGKFAGLFDKGGDLKSGQWGIAGENGPEIVRGPMNITSRVKTARMLAGPQSLPELPSMVGMLGSAGLSGGAREMPPIRIAVEEGALFRPVIKSESAKTAQPISQMNSQAAVGKASRSAAKRSSRKLGL